MKKISDLIESITKRGVKTLCHPRSTVKEHIPISTVPQNYFRGYIVNRDKLEITDSGGLMTKLPSKSNLKTVEKHLDKLSKSWGGFKGSYRKPQPKQNQISWIDGFNRYMATKSENPEGVTYVLRADVANDLSQKGLLLVQCDESFCDILIPSQISVDINKYSVALDDERKNF